MAAVSEPARFVGLGRGLRTLLVAALVVVLAEALLAAWAAPQLGWSFSVFLSSLLLWTGFGYLLVTALAWTGGARILYVGAGAPFYFGSSSFRQGWEADRRNRIDERASSVLAGSAFGGLLILVGLALMLIR